MELQPSSTSNNVSVENSYIKPIKIKIIKLNNIRIKDFPIDIDITVQYRETTIGNFQRRTIATPEVEIDFTATIEIDTSKHEELNKLAGTPIVFTVSEIPTKRKKSTKEEKVKFGGRCYLDLLPILLGEMVIVDQPLLVELSAYSVGQDMVPWTHLPMLYVDVKMDEPLVTKETSRDNNVLFLTIESIYNINSIFHENLLFKVGVEIPINDEVFETAMFNNGSYSDNKDPENVKLWHGLPHIPGKNAMTKYRVSEDHHEIQNQTGYSLDFKSVINQSSLRINWNTLKRFYMTKSAIENLKKSLYMKKSWPIEIVAEKKQDVQKEKLKSQESQVLMHLISYFDFSSLVYPGTSRVRIASRILPFDQDEYILRSRSEKPLFEESVVIPGTPQKETTSGKNKKESSKRNQIDDSAFNPQSVLDSQMFIIIEIEFLHPIVEEPSKEYLFARINELIPPPKGLPMILYSMKSTKESFRNSLIALRGKLQEEFCNFIEHAQNTCCKACKNSLLTGKDVLPEFTQFLIKRNTYSLIKETLKKHVTDMFRQEYGKAITKGNFHDVMEDTQNLFICMVEEMYETLNSYVEGEVCNDSSKKYTVSDMQLYCALEALEEDRYETAKEWHLKRLDASDTDAELWIDYGIFLLRIGETDDAMLCLKKVLKINQKHCTGLLLYAILLTEKKLYGRARMFFQALTQEYNNFKEGWIAFNIYFVIMDDKVGQEETLKKVAKISTSSDNGHLRQYPTMCWRDMDNLSSQYLQAASLFLKINAFKFAEVALAKELALTQDPKSYPYLYYSSVLSYLSGQIYESYDNLSEIIFMEGENYLLWFLYGHINYKLGMKKSALIFFQYVLSCPKCPDDLHTTYLRMGFIYFEESNYNCALEAFANACAFCPTPFSWLQAGITAYEAGYYEVAELALSESNTLDKCAAKTWYYLALLNLEMKRYEAFHFCYRQAKILNFDDEDLEKKLACIKKQLSPS